MPSRVANSNREKCWQKPFSVNLYYSPAVAMAKFLPCVIFARIAAFLSVVGVLKVMKLNAVITAGALIPAGAARQFLLLWKGKSLISVACASNNILFAKCREIFGFICQKAIQKLLRCRKWKFQWFPILKISPISLLR